MSVVFGPYFSALHYVGRHSTGQTVLQAAPLTILRREFTYDSGATRSTTDLDQRNAVMSEEAPLRFSVPAAGKKYFGLSRNGAYDAAARGDLPTIRIGRLLRVPVRALEAMLNEAGQRRETEHSEAGRI